MGHISFRRKFHFCVSRARPTYIAVMSADFDRTQFVTGYGHEVDSMKPGVRAYREGAERIFCDCDKRATIGRHTLSEEFMTCDDEVLLFLVFDADYDLPELLRFFTIRYKFHCVLPTYECLHEAPQ